MKFLISALLVGGLLVGCTSLPPSVLPGRDEVRDFALEARFALRVTLPDQKQQSSAGRLSWTHNNSSDHLLVSSPLGYGLAEIDSTPTLSRLHTADGKSRESTDPDALMEDVTGQRLPVSRLAAWLLGRPSSSAEIDTDHLRRPLRLREAGWQVDYAYPNDAPSALPDGLTLRRDEEIELRLRIEEWRANP